jgi:hypothetical protein
MFDIWLALAGKNISQTFVERPHISKYPRQVWTRQLNFSMVGSKALQPGHVPADPSVTIFSMSFVWGGPADIRPEGSRLIYLGGSRVIRNKNYHVNAQIWILTLMLPDMTSSYPKAPTSPMSPLLWFLNPSPPIACSISCPNPFGFRSNNLQIVQ